METRTNQTKKRKFAPKAKTSAQWICVKQDTVIGCKKCGTVMLVNPEYMLINAESVLLGNLILECDCGSNFSVEDFLVAGSPMKRGLEAAKHLN